MLQRVSALARAGAEPPDPVIRSSSFPLCLDSSQNLPPPLPRVVVPDILDNAQSCIPVRFLVRKKIVIYKMTLYAALPSSSLTISCALYWRYRSDLHAM